MPDDFPWVWERLKDGLRPELPLTVSEWASRYRILPPTSAEPGRWRNDRTPFLAEIMDALSVHSPTERVVFMKGAQIGATEAGNNWIGYVIHNAPGLMLAVLPSLDDIKRNSATRIDPLIECSPVLKERVVEPRSREPGNSMFRKKFLGGELVLTGATSAKGLRSTPARYLFMDEIDAYPADADDEGDPVALAIQRTVTFKGRRKIYLVSTPTLKGFSRIEAAYLESDRRIFEVPCLDVGGHHTQAAYNFVRGKDARRVWAVKGHNIPGKAIWPRKPSKDNKGRVPLYMVGVSAAKEAIYARLKITEPGPGFLHFPADRPDTYFRQLTAERMKTVYVKGRATRVWEAGSRRNEALDLKVYNLAALYGLQAIGLDLNGTAAVLSGLPDRVSGQAVAVPAIMRRKPTRSTWLSG